MPESTPAMLSPLSGERFVAVAGADAEKFLNAQLSRNVAPQGERAPLAAWHDSKGRVRALLRVLRHADQWLLLLHGANPDTLIQRLEPFILRDEVALRDASGEWRCAAVLGGVDDWLEGRGSALSGKPGDLARVGGAFVIRAGPALAYLAAPQHDFSGVESQLASADGNAARLAEIREGLPEVTAELAGRFPPQALNLDRLHAIAFDKGCYPGQEIIARIRHLGRVKRRLFRFSAPLQALPPAGSPLVDASGSEVGEVLRTATAEDGRIELLAVAAIDAAESRLVCLGEPETPLSRESLPGETGVTEPRASDEGRGSRRESTPNR